MFQAPFGTRLHWLFVEAKKMSAGRAGQDSEAKKYDPERSGGWRFICPDPKGMVLPAEEVYLCLSKKAIRSLGKLHLIEFNVERMDGRNAMEAIDSLN